MSDETVQAAVPVGIRIVIDDEESIRHSDKGTLSKEDVLETIAEANGLVERGSTVAIIIRFQKSNGRYTRATLAFNSVVEPHEILSFGESTPPEIVKWADENDFSSPPEEPPCGPGESFVHLTINDERRGVIGRVTAFMMIGHEDAYAVSFAFCNKADEFSRRTGRMISRDRMNKGDFVYIRKFDGNSRFDTIRMTIQDYMTNGKTCMLHTGYSTNEVTLPNWLSPDPHPDIPAEVQVILRKIAFGGEIEGIDRKVAMDYLGLSGKYQTKFVMHEDQMNNFDQAALTFEVD